MGFDIIPQCVAAVIGTVLKGVMNWHKYIDIVVCATSPPSHFCCSVSAPACRTHACRCAITFRNPKEVYEHACLPF